jgi:hypothetical protein
MSGVCLLAQAAPHGIKSQNGGYVIDKMGCKYCRYSTWLHEYKCHYYPKSEIKDYDDWCSKFELENSREKEPHKHEIDWENYIIENISTGDIHKSRCKCGALSIAKWDPIKNILGDWDWEESKE